MKKIFPVFVTAFLLANISSAQLLVEDFTGYTTASNLAGQGSWTKGGSGPDATVETTTPLTYSGYNGGAGNYVQIPAASTTTSRVYKAFTTTTVSTGTFYLSFLVNISAVNSTGDYFISLGDAGGGTTYAPRIFARSSGSGYVFGIGKQDNVGAAVFGSTVLSFNTTYLVVVRYSGVTGTSNDLTYLWVNPSLGSEPATSGAEASKSTGNDISSIGQVVWHNRSLNNPVGTFDALRVAYGSTSVAAWTNLSAATSSATDAFRTKTSGNWNSTSTWESSSNGSTWINATLTPTSSAGAITIQSGHTVTATSDITMDEATVQNGGVLNINPGVTLTLNDGTGTDLAVATGGSLTFLSDATGTGRLANLGTATIAQDNNVTVQRYIPAKSLRKYDFIASPVTATIANSWQQQIHITGPGTGGTPCSNTLANAQPTQHSNGFDATASNNPSFFIYEQTNPAYWTSIGGTNINLTPGTGYRVNVRGNRNDATNGGCAMLNTTNPAAPGAVTLSATGTLNTGATNVTIDDAYELLGNPYPSEIDFNAFQASNSSVITQNLWLYNPQRGQGVNSYTTYNAGTNTYAGGALPAGYYSAGSAAIIASGQAFFVEKNGAGGTATFNEAHKSTTAQLGMFKTTTWNNIIRVALERANDTASLDNAVTIFDNTIGSATYNAVYDAHTLNSGTYIAFIKGAEQLAIQSRKEVTNIDTVALFVASSSAAAYHLHFTEHQGMNANVYLVDHYTNTVQDVKSNPYYSFSTDGNSLSQGASRFEIVFVNNSVPNGISNVPVVVNAVVYPNPVGNKINIVLPGKNGKALHVTIIDAQGRKVLTENVTASNNLLQVNASLLTPGVYFVKVAGESNYRATAKFIK